MHFRAAVQSWPWGSNCDIIMTPVPGQDIRELTGLGQSLDRALLGMALAKAWEHEQQSKAVCHSNAADDPQGGDEACRGSGARGADVTSFLPDPSGTASRPFRDMISSLQEKHGKRIEITMLDVGHPANRWLQFDPQRQIGLPKARRGRAPKTFIGPSLDHDVRRTLLVGSSNIAEELGSNAGGAPLHFALGDTLGKLRQLVTATPEPTPESETRGPLTASTPIEELLAVQTPAEESLTTARLLVDPKPIGIACSAEPGCPKCRRTKYALNLLVHRYPRLKATAFDISQDKELEKWLEELTAVYREKGESDQLSSWARAFYWPQV